MFCLGFWVFCLETEEVHLRGLLAVIYSWFRVLGFFLRDPGASFQGSTRVASLDGSLKGSDR